MQAFVAMAIATRSLRATDIEESASPANGSAVS
ncbi:hypothetical protein P3T22_000256 [Paraburkholderia sp. GAS348]